MKIHKVDAKGQILGRLATRVSNLLRGKDKVTFVPHQDCGDTVLVYNTKYLQTTGRKAETKIYYRHSGRIGNLKKRQLKDVPMDEALQLAVAGMLPRNKLKSRWLKRLKIFSGELSESKPGDKNSEK